MTDIADSGGSAFPEKAVRRTLSARTVAAEGRPVPVASNEPHRTGAVSYAARATDERVTYLRIYADSNGETHMQDVDIKLLPRALFKDRPPLRLSDTLAASGCNLCRVPSGMREVNCHNPPRRELVMARPFLILLMGTLSLATCTSCSADLAVAENYPIRPIKMIVPYPPGGGNDVVARILVQRLSEAGVHSYVENLPGAGGTIGTGIAAKAPADGYTIALVNQDFVIQSVVKATVPYNPFDSFAPVILVATAPESISIHPSLPASNILELIALLKSNPGKYGYASPGYGTSPHVASERLFKLTYGLDVTHVPFQGAAPAITSTIAGHTAILPFGLYVVAPHIRDGKLRALAVTDSKRSPLLPDVPTLTEAGVQGHDYGFWVGVVAPAGTQAAIITQLNRLIAQITLSREVQERLAALGFRPIGSAPDEFHAQLKAEFARWSKVVRDAGIKID